MFLQVLGTFEVLSTLFALMGFERDVDSKMTCDVVSFGGLGRACPPTARQTQIFCLFAPNMFLAQMVLRISDRCMKKKYIKVLGVHESFYAITPLADKMLTRTHFRDRLHCEGIRSLLICLQICKSA